MSKMLNLKNATRLAVCLTVLLVAGCRGDNLPSELRNAPQPIKLIVVNEEGVMISDGDGKLYVYNETYFFAQIIMKGEFKKGDVLTSN